MNPLCYIIGPYAPYDAGNRTVKSRENVSRAVALGALALKQGLVPVIPHVTIGCSSLWLGEYTNGDADRVAREASYGTDDRFGGLARAISKVQFLRVWVLRRDDGTLSAGTARELAIVRLEQPPFETWLTYWSWPGSSDAFQRAGLGDLYTDVDNWVSPPRFPRWPGDS